MGWYQQKMPFYRLSQGSFNDLSVLGQPFVPPVAGSVTDAAPEDECCGVLCSRSEATTRETSNPLGGPLPSASYTSLRIQVGYSGVDSQGTGYG